jgi:bifunctional UDP-N-acetylglucosamine pyrophosphorylase/glucosamine-1-phosphate N-acetyltransferase
MKSMTSPAPLTLPELFDVSLVEPLLRPLLDVDAPWHILAALDDFLQDVAVPKRRLTGDVHPTAVIEGDVYLAEGASVAPHALIQGPAWIGEGASVGHGAYIRGGVVLAAGAKVGHASEIKHALLLEQATAAHFNYVGDGILGRGVNLGAGVKLANLAALGQTIKVAGEDSGRSKFSAAVGDGVFIGCNAVLQPGSIIGARSVVYGTALVRGVVPADTVVKARQTLEHAPKHR